MQILYGIFITLRKLLHYGLAMQTYNVIKFHNVIKRRGTCKRTRLSSKITPSVNLRSNYLNSCENKQEMTRDLQKTLHANLGWYIYYITKIITLWAGNANL